MEAWVPRGTPAVPIQTLPGPTCNHAGAVGLWVVGELTARGLPAVSYTWVGTLAVHGPGKLLLNEVRVPEPRSLNELECEVTWEQITTDGEVPTIHVWASVREDGDTKTQRSKRSLELPDLALKAIGAHRARQAHERLVAGELWQDNNLVFCTRNGPPLDRHNVLRELRTIMRKAGLNDKEWTARELRHTFVSLLSDHDVSIEEISLLVGTTAPTLLSVSTAAGCGRCDGPQRQR